MTDDEWRERLANDENLLDALDDGQAERAVRWAERMISLEPEDTQRDHVLKLLQRLNRAIERGYPFDSLMDSLESALPDPDRT